MLSRVTDLKIVTVVSVLKSCQSDVLFQLYKHPATCLALYRALTESEQVVVMRLLFVSGPVASVVVVSWFTDGFSFSSLRELKLIDETRSATGSLYSLNASYAASLKLALCGQAPPWNSPKLEEDKYGKKTIEFLDHYATERWETLLDYMVGSKKATANVSKEMVLTLIKSDLMHSQFNASKAPSLTARGFQFLLQDMTSQVWYFIMQYITRLQSGEVMADLLRFLFELSFCNLGCDYSMANVSESQLPFLQTLRELGFVYMRKRKDGRYCPTKLAISLSSFFSEHAVNKEKVNQEGFIIIETNFRIYAYTHSELHLALIAMFSSSLYRFPNMCCSILTRDSCRQAFSMGITSSQIIHYIESHRHPEMGDIPPTLIDQIKLWEMETLRVSYTESVLYSGFITPNQFEFLRDYAEQVGCLLNSNSEKRYIVVTETGHDTVKKYWKRHKANFES